MKIYLVKTVSKHFSKKNNTKTSTVASYMSRSLFSLQKIEVTSDFHFISIKNIN